MVKAHSTGEVTGLSFADLNPGEDTSLKDDDNQTITLNRYSTYPAWYFDPAIISDDYEKMFKGISRNNEELLAKKDARISELESQIEAEKRSEDEYVQITRELRYRYQDISDVSISRGLNIASENMDVSRRINVIAFAPQPLDQSIVSDIEGWLKVRMNDSTVVVMNIVR